MLSHIQLLSARFCTQVTTHSAAAEKNFQILVELLKEASNTMSILVAVSLHETHCHHSWLRCLHSTVLVTCCFQLPELWRMFDRKGEMPSLLLTPFILACSMMAVSLMMLWVACFTWCCVNS